MGFLLEFLGFPVCFNPPTPADIAFANSPENPVFSFFLGCVFFKLPFLALRLSKKPPLPPPPLDAFGRESIFFEGAPEPTGALGRAAGATGRTGAFGAAAATGVIGGAGGVMPGVIRTDGEEEEAAAGASGGHSLTVSVFTFSWPRR